MHRPTLSLLLVLLSVDRAALADQAPTPPPTGVIAGTLVSADLGRPVRKAQVRIVSTSPRLTRTTTSDGDGAYVFDKLPAAEYTLSASKPGYLETVYGSSRPGPSVPGLPIRVDAGQKVERVTLRLPRGGVISGVISDEFGDPALGVPVRAMRFTYSSSGERAASAAGNAVTDDLGSYRIAGLLPGDYVVSAVPRDNVVTAAASAESIRNRAADVARAGGVRDQQALAEAGKPPDPTGYVPLYFGGTSSPGAATAVRVGVAAETGGIDIRLQVLKTGSISGIVTNPDGTHASANIQLIDPLMPIANLGVWFRNASPGGKFAFPGLVPGSYVIRAQAGSSSSATGRLTAAATVSIDDGAAAEVTLALRPGVSVSGQLDLSTLRSPGELRRLSVGLEPITTTADWEMEPRRATPGPDGRFVVRGVAPGRYRVTVTGLSEGSSLASAVFGDKDAADNHVIVEAGEDITDGVVKLTAKTGEVAGAVTSASGEPVTDRTVILFSSERAHWVPRSRRIHVVQPAADGRYAIRGLPQGEYRLTTIDGLEPGQQFDPAFLARLGPEALTIKIGEGERRTQDLRPR